MDNELYLELGKACLCYFLSFYGSYSSCLIIYTLLCTHALQVNEVKGWVSSQQQEPVCPHVCVFVLFLRKQRLGGGDPWPLPQASRQTAYLVEWMTSDLSSSQRLRSARVRPGGFQGGFQETYWHIQENMTFELFPLQDQTHSFGSLRNSYGLCVTVCRCR